MKKKVWFYFVFVLIFLFLSFSCSKTFNGSLVERKDVGNRTFIQANGNSYTDVGFGVKGDIQPYITIKNNNYGLVLSASYEQIKSINMVGFRITNGSKKLEFICDKVYTSSVFFVNRQTCDALLKNNDYRILNNILNSNDAKVYLKGELDVILNIGGGSIEFSLTPTQRKVFKLVLEKYESIKK